MRSGTSRGDDAIEHESEIRSGGRRTPALLLVAALIGVVAFVALRGGDPAVDGPEIGVDERPSTTPTSETLTTTRPPTTVPVYGLVSTDRGPLPFSTGTRPARSSASPVDDDVDVAGAPISTAGTVAVLDRNGVLRVGEPGRSFEVLGCCWDDLHPSTELGHVWGRLAGELRLLRLDGLDVDPPSTLSVGSDRVLGPASFGVITVDARGAVVWRRPRFEPTPVPLPEDRTALDAGGEVVLVEAPASSDGRTLEAYGVADGRLRQVLQLPSGPGAPRLAPDGTHVIAPTPSHWTVRQVRTGSDVGRLPPAVDPVWVGGHRFAAVVPDGRIFVSDGRRLEPPWPVRALAEASPTVR